MERPFSSARIPSSSPQTRPLQANVTACSTNFLSRATMDHAKSPPHSFACLLDPHALFSALDTKPQQGFSLFKSAQGPAQWGPDPRRGLWHHSHHQHAHLSWAALQVHFTAISNPLYAKSLPVPSQSLEQGFRNTLHIHCFSGPGS